MEPLEGSRKAALAQSIELVPDPKRPMGFQVRRRHRSRFSEQLILRMALRDTPPRSGNLDLRLLAEGDSWCNLLWPVSGYPKTLVDVLSEQYYTVNLGWPGDTFKKILQEQQDVYRQPLQSNTFDYFIFSAGGVDFFTALTHYAKAYQEGDGSDDPNDYIKPGFDRFLNTIGESYEGVAKQVTTWTSRTTLLLHGYDHAIPKPGGIFLGQRFEGLGYDVAGGMPRKIVREAIDRYYTKLFDVADKTGRRVSVVDCRGAVGTRWHDELHATTTGAGAIAERFLQAMDIPSPALVASAARSRSPAPNAGTRSEESGTPQRGLPLSSSSNVTATSALAESRTLSPSISATSPSRT